jgi:hypothetical protein
MGGNTVQELGPASFVGAKYRTVAKYENDLQTSSKGFFIKFSKNSPIKLGKKALFASFRLPVSRGS